MDLITNIYSTNSNLQNRPGLVTSLLDNLKNHGECISLSAPNNFGKTHFLRQLFAASSTSSQSEVQMVFIDCNLRADDSQQGFYALILKELLAVFYNNELDKLYRELVASPTGDSFQINHLFLVIFEVVRDLLLRKSAGKNRLVLVLDEFDQVSVKLPAAVFRHLRGLKDRHGKGLVYLVGTNRPLHALGREEEEDVAEFYELFDLTNQVHLQPLSQEESNEIIKANLTGLPAKISGWVYPLAGGHPGLTHRLIQILKTMGETGPTNLEEFTMLARLDPQLKLEGRRIWNSLDPSERVALLQQLEGIKTLTADPLLGTLEERGLIKSSSCNSVGSMATSEVFAGAFRWFLEEKLQAEKERSATTSAGYSFDTDILPITANNINKTSLNQNRSASIEPSQSTKSRAKVCFDPVHEIIIFEDDSIAGSGKSGNHIPLTGNSALLFKYLFLRQSIPYCSKDELISAVWGQEAAYSSENLDRLVSDLRQLIGDHDKQIIRTIHRRGLQMVGVREWRSHASQ